MNNHSVIMMFALRYSLGRSSTAPALVVDYIKENINELSIHQRFLMSNEVEDFLEHSQFGDRVVWEHLVGFLKESMSNAKTKI